MTRNTPEFSRAQADPLPFPQLLLDYLLTPEAPAIVPPSTPPVAPAPLPGHASPLTRARAYLAACDPAISGQGGHNQTFKIACKLIKGFGLDPETAFHLLLADYNPRCQPPLDRTRAAPQGGQRCQCAGRHWLHAHRQPHHP